MQSRVPPQAAPPAKVPLAQAQANSSSSSLRGPAAAGMATDSGRAETPGSPVGQNPGSFVRQREDDEQEDLKTQMAMLLRRQAKTEHELLKRKVRAGEVTKQEAVEQGMADEWRADVPKVHMYQIPSKHKFEKIDDGGFGIDNIGACALCNVSVRDAIISGMKFAGMDDATANSFPNEWIQGIINGLQQCSHPDAETLYQGRVKNAKEGKFNQRK